MPVPEAPMYKYDLLEPREHKIGRSRKGFDMKPVPIPKRVAYVANYHFGFRPPLSN